MVRFPYTLEMWYEEDATLKPDGTFTDQPGKWVTVCPCNARQNGQARQIRGQYGEAFTYAFEVVMPPDAPPVPIGARVRIFDICGRDVLTGALRDGEAPQTDETASYAVRGIYKSGQRYEDTRLWL